MLIHDAYLTGSFIYNGTDISDITGSEASVAALNQFTSSYNTGSFTGSFRGSGSGLNGVVSASFATTSLTSSFANNLTVTGTITAQTLNVQQVTSSVIFSSGSNVFGNSLLNTQVMTGSVNITGSLTVTTTGTELQVTSTGVNLGNIVTDNHNVTGSLRVSGSIVSNGALSGTSATFSGEVNVGTTSGYLNVGTNVNSGFKTYIKAGASGILLSAGSTSSDNTLLIQNAAENTTLFNIKGNGAATFTNTETTLNFNPQTSLLSGYNYLNFGGGSIMYRNASDLYFGSNAKYGSAGTVVANYTTAQGMGMLTMNGGSLNYQANDTSVTAGTAYAVPIRFTINGNGLVSINNVIASSSNYKLGVSGSAYINGSNNKGIFVTDNSTYASIVGLNNAISAYNPLEIRASGTDGQIILHTSGNVSIGNTTDTGDRLYLAGNLKMITNGKIDSNGGYLAINSATGGNVLIGTTTDNSFKLAVASGTQNLGSGFVVNNDFTTTGRQCATAINDFSGTTCTFDLASIFPRVTFLNRGLCVTMQLIAIPTYTIASGGFVVLTRTGNSNVWSNSILANININGAGINSVSASGTVITIVYSTQISGTAYINVATVG